MFRAFVLIFATTAITANPTANHGGLRDSDLLKHLADYSHRSYMVATKRCAGLFEEICINGGLPHAGNDEQWLGELGKRNVEDDNSFFTSLSDFFNRVHLTVNKRCANLFDESCSNGGLPGAGGDEEWLGNLGKRETHSETIYKALADLFRHLDTARDKRCANLFDEGCMNGGLPGAGQDEEWLGGVGRRSLSDLFNRIHMVNTKRCANLFDEGCANGGLPGANGDEAWLGGLGK